MSYLNKIEVDPDFDTCCSNFYNDGLVKFFLGNSYHPGGIELTLELAEKMGITSDSIVLDVACGIGSSALAIARQYGCQVVGIDMDSDNIDVARQQAKKLGLVDVTKFITSKVDEQDFESSSFTHLLCECSFCIFDDKSYVANWFFDLLRPGGTLGISDVAIEKEMPYDLSKTVYRVACVSGALSKSQYGEIFKTSGFTNSIIMDRRDVILDLSNHLKKKLIGLKLIKTFKSQVNGVKLNEIDLDEVKKIIDQMNEFVEKNYGSYFLYIGQKHID